jgi:hypothetical protein
MNAITKQCDTGATAQKIKEIVDGVTPQEDRVALIGFLNAQGTANLKGGGDNLPKISRKLYWKVFALGQALGISDLSEAPLDVSRLLLGVKLNSNTTPWTAVFPEDDY